jgi:hypothetical protein
LAGASDDRRRIYTFALEQAEQMFQAAANVGQATGPLLVFYGLSQAGRAIAAAGVRDRGWRLSGHGITARGLDGPLAEIAVRCTGAGRSGSFVRLSELLDSPVWRDPDSVAFGSLWDCVPGNRLAPLVDDESRRCPLLVDTARMHGEPHPLATVPICYFPPWVVSSPDGRQRLAAYLDAFPGAKGYHSFVREGPEPGSQPSFFVELDSWGELQMNWLVEDGQECDSIEQLHFLMGITRLYNDSCYFFPALGRADKSIHPLMAWWAVLYVLSMLARYEPTQWTGYIDVDRNAHAVPLENLLKTAMVLVPTLIGETIWRVASFH